MIIVRSHDITEKGYPGPNEDPGPYEDPGLYEDPRS